MPIYEFHCEKCERDSEILVRSSRWQGTKCPHCGSAKLAKKLSVFASSGGGTETGAAPVLRRQRRVRLLLRRRAASALSRVKQPPRGR